MEVSTTAIDNVQKFKYMNVILTSYNVDEYIPMDENMCIYYRYPLLI